MATVSDHHVIVSTVVDIDEFMDAAEDEKVTEFVDAAREYGKSVGFER